MSTGATPSSSPLPGGMYARPRADWLRLHDESVIDETRVIVDAHHHLWDRPDARYLLDDILAEINSGHNIVATVYVDSSSMYKCDGPAEMRPVGEVEFANGIAAMSASGSYGSARVCAAIVGFADLLLGDKIKPLLELQKERGGSRFRGVRRVTSWNSDQEINRISSRRQPGLLLDAKFREGFANLHFLDLSFDAFVFHPQIPELTDLARAFPNTQIVLDHLGGFIGLGSYASKKCEVFEDWRRSIRVLAKCENVFVKLGGLGMRLGGFGFDELDSPASSQLLAEAWRPYIEASIEAFGVERSMFQSNFPPDKGTCSYRVLWNAFKRVTAGASESEKDALFSGSACRFYKLQVPTTTSISNSSV
jgi:predicted TIM-barrel fold metal-dependent hydrolase